MRKACNRITITYEIYLFILKFKTMTHKVSTTGARKFQLKSFTIYGSSTEGKGKQVGFNGFGVWMVKQGKRFIYKGGKMIDAITLYNNI